MTSKPTTEDLSMDCRDLAKNPALTERNRRMLADVADRLMALERERDFARFREDSARNVMRKFRRELEQLRAEVGDDPLTLDELRGMDGEPVWVRSTNGNARCRVCAGVYDNPQTGGAEVLFDGQPDIMVWDGGKTWLAYRRKPDGGGE